MSSKAKLRAKQLTERFKRTSMERQQYLRTLLALCRQQSPITLKWDNVNAVEDDDRLHFAFDKHTGDYTITLVEADNGNGLGRRSEAEGLHVGEGDVAGPVPET